MSDGSEQYIGHENRPSASAWIVIHIFIPLLPFLMGSLVRFISYPSLTWATFSAPQLALTIGLISVFVRTSLLDTEIQLPNPDKEEEVAKFGALCFLPIVAFFILYGLIEVFRTLVFDRSLNDVLISLRFSQVLAFLLAPLSILFFLHLQRSFRLRARIR